MRAVVPIRPGGADVLTMVERLRPAPRPGEVLVRVAAAGVNRADVVQRAGHYPPPPGAFDVLGLECSGEIVEVGAGVVDWKVGDPVCALLAAGGYAEFVTVPVADLVKHVWPLISDGRVRPVVYQTFRLKNAAHAHRLMERSDHAGKLVIVITDPPGGM